MLKERLPVGVYVKTKREREALRAWDNPTPEDEKRQARPTKKKRKKTKAQKRARRVRKRTRNILGRAWKSLTTEKQRLGYLKNKAGIPQVPRDKRRPRRKRKPLNRHHRCVCCGSVGRVVRHHVIPISCGGPDRSGNIVRVCYDCHARIHPWMQHAPADEKWLENEAGALGLSYS